MVLTKLKLKAIASVLLSLLSLAAAVAKPNPPRSIKLMTYNIHAWRDASHCCNFDRIVQIVKESKPDILCLNEVLHPFARPSSTSHAIRDYYRQVKDGQGKNNPIDPSFLPEEEKLSFLHRLADATGLTNLDFVEATDNSYFGQGVSFGNAILTCHPIVDSCHVLMQVEEGDAELSRQKRDFVDPRSFGIAMAQIDDKHCIGVAYGHLDHKSEELREKQIQTALRKVESFLKDVPRIICGDFNTFQKSDCDPEGWQAILDLYNSRGWPVPPERSLVLDALTAQGYRDTFYDQSSSQALLPNPTSWSNKPLMRIDHIYTKATTKEGATKIIPKLHYRLKNDASDHFPVLLEADLETHKASV